MSRIIALACIIISFSQLSFSSTDVYRCIGEYGIVSFGDKPCPVETVVGSSEAHQVWRKMLPMVNEGLKVYSTLGPDFYSIKACLVESENFQNKLRELSEPLYGLSIEEHADMYAALDSLKECGNCRASAPNYCEKATAHLMREIRVLTAYEIKH